MKHLYFLRHGLSEMNKSSIWTGDSDSPLAPEGHEQAIKAGKKIKELGLEFDLIISSPLSRALDTAVHVASELGYPENKIKLHPEIIERDFGTLEGNKSLVAATKYVINEAAIDEYEGVEALADLQKRADKFWEYLQTLSDESVLVVGHGAFARALRRAIKNEPLSSRGHRLGNAELVQYV